MIDLHAKHAREHADHEAWRADLRRWREGLAALRADLVTALAETGRIADELDRFEAGVDEHEQDISVSETGETKGAPTDLGAEAWDARLHHRMADLHTRLHDEVQTLLASQGRSGVSPTS